jgi:hypothetical protein
MLILKPAGNSSVEPDSFQNLGRLFALFVREGLHLDLMLDSEFHSRRRVAPGQLGDGVDLVVSQILHGSRLR